MRNPTSPRASVVLDRIAALLLCEEGHYQHGSTESDDEETIRAVLRAITAPEKP
jgi:hypothetical protein